MRKAVFVSVTLLLVSCSLSPKRFSAHFFAMDTHVEVTLFVRSKNNAGAAVKALKAEAKRIEALFSAFAEGSEIRRINQRRDRRRTTVPEEVLNLIKQSLAYGAETQGLFDLTIAPVKWAWGFGTGLTPHRPDPDTLKQRLRHVDYRTLSIRADTLFFSDTAVLIDLGGIAKGYALTRFQAIVKKHGIRSYMINAGGDIVCGDPKPDGADWVIGVRHPRDKGGIIRILKLSNAAVVTSGDYERFFIKDGRRYHHIFNPRTGYPARGVISATVVSDDPVRADVYGTVLVAAEKPEGIGAIPGVGQYILFDDSLDMATVGSLNGGLHE
jgi:thiamine biosynthesis lipoprotein